jgi:hypothetical protein
MDYMKGLAVLWFTCGHCMQFWAIPSNTWDSPQALIALLLDWTGPALFVSVTVIGTMLSIRQKQLTGQTKGMFWNGFKKATFLIIVGEIMNVFINAINISTNGMNLGAWIIFGANMILVVGCAQIFTYGMMKLSWKARLALGILLIAIYPLLLDWCLPSLIINGSRQIATSASVLITPQYIVYYLLFYLDGMDPTISWLITTLLTGVIFSPFVEAHARAATGLPGGDDKAKARSVRSLLVLGGLAIAASVLGGSWLLNKGYAFAATLYNWLVTPGYRLYFLPGLPLFLVRHCPNYLLFNLGLLAVSFGLLQRRAAAGKTIFLQDWIANLGRFSFTLFLAGDLLLIKTLYLTWYQFSVVIAIVEVGYLLVTRLWAVKGRSIGSLEWLAQQYDKGLNIIEAKVRARLA